MGQIKVRQLDNWIVGVHQDMAKMVGQSLEQYLRDMLRERALETQRSFGQKQAAMLAKAKEKYGVLPDSTEGIREERWSSS